MKERKPLEICTIDSLGYRLTGEDASKLTEVVDDYLFVFLAPNKDGCVLCGRELGGLMGTFTWDIAHGEGFCGNCKWPARAIHYINDADGDPVFNMSPRWILQYSPYALTSEWLVKLELEQVMQEDVDRIQEIRKWASEHPKYIEAEQKAAS